MISGFSELVKQVQLVTLSMKAPLCGLVVPPRRWECSPHSVPKTMGSRDRMVGIPGWFVPTG